MTMMNICNCECDVISTIEYWWSELNISKQSYSRPEMRRNVRGSASFPSTVATASPSLLVLIGGLRLRHVSSIETGCWLRYLPIYTILSSSITHVPIEFSFCLECFSSGQKILQSILNHKLLGRFQFVDKVLKQVQEFTILFLGKINLNKFEN